MTQGLRKKSSKLLTHNSDILQESILSSFFFSILLVDLLSSSYCSLAKYADDVAMRYPLSTDDHLVELSEHSFSELGSFG